ncbi:D-alanyl-D-alanine carboxypeptidase/D-alanyl-D-alanine-endopeptidase [Lysinibacillus yapensis]|uniref:D-alanyl-D-alanine carboxypeptidase/D-alanyl-D-alanine-endopeptidase n=1 Tax=Ureibacillus yapensis TaxID=2304605 RepID=A0A396SBY9_9BACL|nr:D-alanyl-D-alanine carboxypeptidase/D-alanyl-D-alanine-endopeptidase [Lysinibacillus yapensis]RHW38550.1 D-alanyl-D-alanine carboxypeptidase/D-alanyl-D-alanine-endopeptidase [Lysinibacillus yapensis]
MKTKTLFLLFAFMCFFGRAFANLDDLVQTRLGNEDISVSIREIDSGELVFEKNGEVGMKPASTLKLLTAAAALEKLQPHYRFKTKLFIDGELKEKVLNGNIYIKGGGDPTLQKKDLVFMASTLKHYGISHVNGNLYGDDTFFSGEPLTPGILKEDESYYFAARISALTISPDEDYDAGTIILNVHAVNPGGRPIVTAEPGAGGMEIINRARTVEKSQKNTIEILREYGTNKILITGNIPSQTTFKDWVTLNDPTLNTLQLMKDNLEEIGITFANHSEIERKKVPEEANLVLTKKSLPLDSLMAPFLKWSNNSIADILTKTLGSEVKGKGNLDEGIRAMKDFGNSMGLQMEKWELEDGSGMSPNNRATANELTDLLSKMAVNPNFLLLYKNLPIGGRTDRYMGGTLLNRFLEEPYKNRVIAKTGHIEGVYTLAGYVQANSGMVYSFAIMTQNQTYNRKPDMDDVVKQIIVEY